MQERNEPFLSSAASYESARRPRDSFVGNKITLCSVGLFAQKNEAIFLLFAIDHENN